jgi:hypothetical protein
VRSWLLEETAKLMQIAACHQADPRPPFMAGWRERLRTRFRPLSSSLVACSITRYCEGQRALKRNTYVTSHQLCFSSKKEVWSRA